MFGKLKEYKIVKDSRKCLESYLLSNHFIIHDVKNEGKTIVYVKNMQTVVIHKSPTKDGDKNGSISFNIGGEELFTISFIPTNTILLEFLMKEAINNNTNN